jgi:hypothetical protein
MHIQLVEQSYGAIEVKHEITKMVRIFRSKQPSTKLAGITFVLQGERDKSVAGTIFMLGNDSKSSQRLAALYTPTKVVAVTYAFESAEKEEPMLALMSRIRTALAKK